MGIKLLWSGFVFMFALPAFLSVFGLSGAPLLPLVGAIFAVLGLFLLWMDK